MKIRSFIPFTFIVLGLIATGCNLNFTIEGNGDPVTEERDLPFFREVNSGGNFLVNITPGETNQLIIKAESNLLPYISTRVSGKILDIEVKGLHSLDPSVPIVIDVVTPALTAVRQSGSGEIQFGSFRADHFEIAESGSGNVTGIVDCRSMEVTVSGSGNVDLEGTAGQCTFTLSGSGNISGYRFPVEICNAVISGSGSIFVHTADFLQVNISGSGSVFYRGQPRVNYSISGSGRVIQQR